MWVSSRLPIALVLLRLWSVPGYSQQSTVVRIGVAILRTSARDVSVAEARNRMVKRLNQLKRGANSKIGIRAIALDSAHISDALGEAKQKDCQYVLTSHVTELLTEQKIMPAVDLQTLDRPEIVVRANVEYELYRVGSQAEFAKGRASGEDAASHRGAVLGAMDVVAHDVVADLARGTSPEDAQQATQLPTAPEVSPHITWLGHDECGWLTGNLPHAEALHGACVFALSLKQKMPNFICDQQTSRYVADESVPRDLISASLRYQDGEESFSEVKVNGRPVPETAARSAGLWSKGEFGGDLRAIFDSENKAVFQYSGEEKSGSHGAWGFRYRIAKQIDPLWVLRGRDGEIAPAYSGELWLDQQTGAVVRFRSVAEDIPPSFAMQSAELAINYGSVKFADGTEFVLPSDSMLATKYRGEAEARNVMRFQNCHKFRAQARMVLGGVLTREWPAQADGAGNFEEAEIERNRETYEILRAEAIREDDQRTAAEHRQELEAGARAAILKLNSLREQPKQELAASQPGTESAHRAASAPPQGEATIKVEVNLVPVSVVTRDTNGRTVGDLEKQNFQLFDERIAQVITRFSVETSEDKEGTGSESDIRASNVAAEPAAAVHHTAYVFDDLHASLEELEKAKKAAAQYVSEMRAGDRAAIFATSGRIALDFTNSQEVLQGALRKLQARGREGESCPPMSYYEADLIVNQGDANAKDIATGDAWECMFKGANRDRAQTNIAAHTAWAKAQQTVANGSEEGKKALQVLRDVIAKTSAMSGRRSIVLISPGFPTLAEDSQAAAMQLIELALRSNIAINALDVAGLDAGLIRQSGGFASPADRIQLNTQEQMARTGVMADLAYGTGGVFFHDNNDLRDGFRQTADVPQYVYVLGFSPQKLDGKFHKLKVAVKSPQKLRVQARPGYYALRPAAGS